MLDLEDGASKRDLGFFMELHLFFALLHWTSSSWLNQRYHFMPNNMSYYDHWKLCNNIGTLASTLSVDVLLHSEHKTIWARFEACPLYLYLCAFAFVATD